VSPRFSQSRKVLEHREPAKRHAARSSLENSLLSFYLKIHSNYELPLRRAQWLRSRGSLGTYRRGVPPERALSFRRSRWSTWSRPSPRWNDVSFLPVIQTGASFPRKPIATALIPPLPPPLSDVAFLLGVLRVHLRALSVSAVKWVSRGSPQPTKNLPRPLNTLRQFHRFRSKIA